MNIFNCLDYIRSNDKIMSNYGDRFVSPPMSFTQFISQSISADYIWEHIWKAAAEMDDNCDFNHYSDISITGCVGSGKSTFYTYLFLYRIYLWMLSKECYKIQSPYENWSQAFDHILVGSRKSITFTLTHIAAMIPELFPNYDSNALEPGKVYYRQNNLDSDEPFTFYTTSGGDIYLSRIVRCYDYKKYRYCRSNHAIITIGCFNISTTLETMSEGALWSELKQIKKDQFVWSESFQCHFLLSSILEKAPYDKIVSPIDNDIYERLKNPYTIEFGPIWEISDKYKLDPTIPDIYIDAVTEEVIDNIDQATRKNAVYTVPGIFKEILRDKDAIQGFIRDFIGKPTSMYADSKAIKSIYDIVQEINNNHLKIVMNKGRFFLQNTDKSIKVDIQDLFA